MIVAVRNGVILIEIHGFDISRGLRRYLMCVLDQTGFDQLANSGGFGRREGGPLQYAGRTTEGLLACVLAKEYFVCGNGTYILESRRLNRNSVRRLTQQ